MDHSMDPYVKSPYDNLVIYNVYVRNHSKNGTFADVKDDLKRIQSMGVDYIWLLPIHPIGKVKRKGTLGSPYSITNYREINPEFGTLDDFRDLVNAIHDLKMKIMLDVVFNHTAHDCEWIHTHPQWYYRDKNGQPTAKVAEWSDIVDLEFRGNEHDLWPELIDSLKYWIEQGVDGFRMDVASSVPIEFWKLARSELLKLKPNVLLLAESTRLIYIEGHTRKNEYVNTDAVLYQAFDLCYDYDLYQVWRAAMAAAVPIKMYLELVRLQNSIYPRNFCKLRFVENHDQERIAKICKNNRVKGLAWTAFTSFNKGTFLLHGGQETENTTTSSLFEKDYVDCKSIYSLGKFMTKLIQIKKHPVVQTGRFVLTHHSPCIVGIWEDEVSKEGLIGVFNVEQIAKQDDELEISNLPDGTYQNLLIDLGLKGENTYEQDVEINVKNGKLKVPQLACILHYKQLILDPQVFYSDIFDFNYRGGM
ncbi:unnamed protein product [Didymodactylos carnosus]|uniref:Glycosyl hydrolase family 13 catalytic domain-containing protein n=1 Tax=Didymodactylos carnosus TaxID=1234261 RepID=A0A814P7F0_9BILA|nr:unnamed protein product [Didymodactylos carnosus]CAF1104599.1 unnamed protein product [Didymodactylos carnosus]CAF3867000.1 unnamed protein product [Didymodactylos carnosus]CAF3867283.1 unnamed protein product [Didymodactylos carnosus]